MSMSLAFSICELFIYFAYAHNKWSTIFNYIIFFLLFGSATAAVFGTLTVAFTSIYALL